MLKRVAFTRTYYTKDAAKVNFFGHLAKQIAPFC